MGRGAFGRPVPPAQHAAEVLDRIIDKGLPLTEDAVFLALHRILSRKNHSRIFQSVKSSSDTGGYRYFRFSPDVDLLEVRRSNEVIGYELKGYRKAGREIKPPAFYEGIGQALALLNNPVSSPLSPSFAGSVFDYCYLVHPAGSEVENLAQLLRQCSPIGLIVADYRGTREIVKPKPNPLLSQEMKSCFLANLHTLSAYTQFKVNPIQ